MKKWIKTKFHNGWIRAKRWWVALLVALGLIVAVPALAGMLSLSWTNPEQRTDGTAFDAATEQAEIRIYCNGDTSPTFVSPGDADAMDQITAASEYTCYATALDTDGQESDPSNTVTKTVLPARPNPPVLDQ